MNNRLVAMLVVALVAGCGSSENTGDAGTRGTARSPAANGAEAVAAVLQSPGAPVAKLGFVVAAKPVVGAPSALRLDISASTPITILQISAAADGLVIDSATASGSLALPVAGTAVAHELKFTPQREGLTEITVRLRTAEAESAETVYVIPVLVAKAAAGG